MIQTLTTKVLNDFITGQGYGVAPSAVEAMARKLLANLESQPVGYIAEVSGNRVGVLRGLPMPDVGSLIYTAPPAPAAVNGRTAEGWMAEALLQKKIADDLRNSAPAVPESMPEVDRGEGGSDIDYMQPQEIYGMGKADGWNACRAAMLAQPVSQGCKLPDGGWISCSEHLPESGQNVITLNNCGGVFGGYVFKKYTDGSYVFVDAEEEYREDDTITHWMPLPAAPEGGNDA
jgi:hypothetical protein